MEKQLMNISKSGFWGGGDLTQEQEFFVGFMFVCCCFVAFFLINLDMSTLDVNQQSCTIYSHQQKRENKSFIEQN